VVVRRADGSCYQVLFYDPVRLQQDLEEYVRLDTPYLAEPGLIVLPEVTTEAIRKAVRDAETKGFFDRLKPLAPTPSQAAMQALPTGSN
jgi:hypothetical protein